MKAKTRRRLNRLECVIFGHEYAYLSRSTDWLDGGTYHYECTRCWKSKESKPIKI